MPTVTQERRKVVSAWGTGTVSRTKKVFSNEEFEEILKESASFSELLKFFTGQYEWDMDDTEDERARLFEKTFALVTTTSEAAALYDRMGNDEYDGRLFERMLELASNHQDLDTIYHRLALSESELRLRNFIRKLFDKADTLDYPIDVG